MIETIEPEARRLCGSGESVRRPVDERRLAAVVAGLSEDRRDWLADLVVLDGQRDLLKPRKMSVCEFQQMLRAFAGNQTIARKKLIGHLRQELLRRGIDMSGETIEERFRANPTVRTMPYCVKQILKGLSDEFRTGLVPIQELIGEEDADRWLRHTQRRLMFRSQSAMHKAIADATGLTYESVHKALAGRKKAKRIQVRVKLCLDEWLRKAEKGEDVAVDERYKGVPVEQMCAFMPRLRESFRTKEAIYRFISEKTGVQARSIRRYFQNDGQLKFAPLSTYRVAKQLASGEIQVVLADSPAPRRRGLGAAGRMAKKTQRALDRWRHQRDNEELARDFKELRRKLIIRLKERRGGQMTAVRGRG